MKSHVPRYNILDQHLDETDFLVIDVETTGLSANGGDRVCEIGAVKLRGGAIMETLGCLIDPQRPISPGAYAVNKISPSMLADAPYFSEIAEKFWNMMNETVLVAYNAPFDLSFVMNEFRYAGYPKVANHVIDALAIARQILPGLQSYQQQKVAALVGIPCPVKHRALEDALTTAQLFTIFTSILKAYGCFKCIDFLRSDLLNVLNGKRLSLLKNALFSGFDIWVRYLSPVSAEISESIVTPKGCVERRTGKYSSTYLNAYSHRDGAEKNFRIDTILDLRIIEK